MSCADRLTITPEEFLAKRPEFKKYDTATIQRFLDRATCLISNRNYGRIRGECRIGLLMDMASHMLYCMFGNPADVDTDADDLTINSDGQVLNSKIDQISVSFAQQPSSNPQEYWLGQSEYGKAILFQLKAGFGIGRFAGGSNERVYPVNNTGPWPYRFLR